VRAEGESDPAVSEKVIAAALRRILCAGPRLPDSFMSIVAPVTAAAPEPRSRRSLIAARLRWLAWALADLVVATWSLLLIAWLTLHWGILPRIEQWRPEIEQRASSALGIPVRIGNISVRSSGWMPSFELQGVVLQDNRNRPALKLPRIVAALSARSLFALELRFEQLLIDGAHLEIRRDQGGRVFVAGLDFSGPGSGDSTAANWFFDQPEFVIRGGSLQWTDEQRNEPPLALTDMQLIVRNGLRHHDIRIDATPPPGWGERFSARGRFTQPLLTRSGDWQRWSGVVHADLPRADVSELRRHITLPFELSQGDGALRAWLDVKDGRPQGVTLDLALREVTLRLANDVEPISLQQVEGRFAAQRQSDGVNIVARRFGFLTADGIRWPRSDMRLAWRQLDGQPPSAGDFGAERLDLGLIAQVASRVPLGAAVRRLLSELDPHGIVNNLSVHWDGALDAPRSYQAKGVLSGLSLASKASADPNAAGRPGLRNASIALNATEKGGDATLEIDAGALEFPGVLAAPVALDKLNAQLAWRVEPARSANALPKVELQVRNARFANADMQGEMSGSWATGAGEGLARGGRYPGLIELNGKLARGDAGRVASYLPLGIPASARGYVERAVRSGRIAGMTMRVKGDLWDFPFHRARTAKEGEFRIAAKVEDVTLAYVPSAPASATQPAFESTWPAFTRVSGELVFDRAAMEVRNAQAQVYGIELTQVNGGIRNLTDRSVLLMDGKGRGPLADMLRFVSVSPVSGWTGKALAQATGSGVADLQLGLSIPLYDARASTVKGSIALAGNDVRIVPDSPLLAAAKGRVDFTHKGFTITQASARVLGGEASFDGGTQADGALRFSGQGIATAEGLRRASELGWLARLAPMLGGQTAYRVGLNFLRGGSEINVTSNLVGLTADLPAPLRKTSAETPLALHYQTQLATDPNPGPASRDTLRFELGTLVQANYLRDIAGDAPHVLRGGIGVMEPAPTPAAGVAALVNLPSIHVDAWESVQAKLFGPSVAAVAPQPATAPAPAAVPGAPDGEVSVGYAPTTIALRAQEVLAGSRRLTHVVAGLSQVDRLWRANLDADQLSGYVEYRPPRRAGGGRVFARLSRLSLPKSDAESVETLLDTQPASSVPALDIVVDDLELRGKRLGRVEVEAVNRTGPEGREWLLSRLTMTMPEARFSANGSWAAAGSAPGSRRRAVLAFKLELADSGALLDRLGNPKAIKGGKGSLAGQVAWLGSPLALDYPTLTGQVNVAVEAGQFLKAQPGAARLLSVLSLQSLPRRLALDFRDVFQEGFAFDTFTGDVTIDKGVARTNNLRMRGVQAAVLMEGSADIERETQNLRVVVVPEINAATASLAYAAINPAVGLGTFLAQVLLRKPLVAAGTREFRVTGPWSDPKVERIERKPGDAVPEIDSPQPGASAPR
jgi:uncharacterized protein (TIGR02099 family)